MFMTTLFTLATIWKQPWWGRKGLERQYKGICFACSWLKFSFQKCMVPQATPKHHWALSSMTPLQKEKMWYVYKMEYYRATRKERNLGSEKSSRGRTLTKHSIWFPEHHQQWSLTISSAIILTQIDNKCACHSEILLTLCWQHRGGSMRAIDTGYHYHPFLKPQKILSFLI